MNFSYALDRIKWGQPMTREAWRDVTVYVFRMAPPDIDQLAKRTADGFVVLWAPSIDDVMATDWHDVPRID